MPNSENERVLERVAEKAAEMSHLYTQWAREELLLPLGKRVRVVITIENEDAVDIEYDTKEKVFDRAPDASDWDEIMALPWNTRRPSRKGMKTEKLLAILEQVRKSGGNTYRGDGFWGARAALNAFFKKHGDKFRTSKFGGHLSIWAAR